mgnify:CR=1 FL=1
MSFQSIITPMNLTLVRDAIVQHIVNIRDSQKQLAKDSGADDLWIDQIINFTVFPKRFRFPDVQDMPCVFVYFNEIDFPTDEQDIYENEASANLVVEYYTVGLNEETQTADSNAEDRLNYLTAQLYKILCSEATNLYVATGRLIKGFKIKSWKRVLAPDDNNIASTVLGAKFEFQVEFTEPTNYTNTFDIKEFYTKADIRDENIDPFVRIILE